MLHKIITLFFALILFTDIFAQNLSHQNYFPVKTGNSWEYHVLFEIAGQMSEDQGFDIAAIKEQKVMPNGITYFKTSRLFFLNNINWIREYSGRVYFYDEKNSTDNLIFNFNDSVGDTVKFNIQFSDGAFAYISDKGTKDILGDSTTIIKYHISYGVDREYIVSFSDKFGPVEILSWGYPGKTTLLLTGCCLDNSAYGLPLSAGKENRTKTTEFSLGQNFPNPFNPSTVINYSLSEEGFVRLEVFDAIGRKVSSLVNEVKPAGKYSVTFNAADIPGGVYFYRLESGKAASTRKLILLK